MSQILVDIYAIVNVALFLYYLYKYGISNSGVIIFAFYTIIALFAIPAYEILKSDSYFSQFNFSNITLFPYVYLLIITLLLIRPTFHFNGYIQKHNISVAESKVKLFVIVYSLCSILAIYCYYRTIVENVSAEALSQIRNDLYGGESMKAHKNFIEHIVTLFVFNFNGMATIVFFYVLAYMRAQIAKIWFFILAMGIVAPTFMVAIMTASRGMIVSEFFQLLFCYSFYSNSYSKRLKRSFTIVCAIILVIFGFYTILVTISRFGEGDDSMSSIISYFGQPTIIFNSQVSEISSYAYGVRFFYPWANILGIDPDMILNPIVKKWSPCFDTLTGDLYIDFGPIGTFLIALLVPVIFNNFVIRKKCLKLPDIYLLLYYCMIMQRGALVTGYGMCVDILFCIAVYWVSCLLLNKPDIKLLTKPHYLKCLNS